MEPILLVFLIRSFVSPLGGCFCWGWGLSLFRETVLVLFWPFWAILEQSLFVFLFACLFLGHFLALGQAVGWKMTFGGYFPAFFWFNFGFGAVCGPFSTHQTVVFDAGSSFDTPAIVVCCYSSTGSDRSASESRLLCFFFYIQLSISLFDALVLCPALAVHCLFVENSRFLDPKVYLALGKVIFVGFSLGGICLPGLWHQGRCCVPGRCRVARALVGHDAISWALVGLQGFILCCFVRSL